MRIYPVFKRSLDLIVASLLLLVLSPLFLIVIPLLRFTGEGEVFYRQDRVGYKNKIFKIWKFATMLKDSPNLGSGDVTLRNDPRVTKVGHFLRISKINELPQIFNLFMGDMTLVGPRPLMKNGFDRYSDFYKERVYQVVPGITGIGSIVFRDEEKVMTDSKLSPHDCYRQVILPHKGAVELWYQERMSFWLDLKIILLTAWVVIRPKSEAYKHLLKDLPQLNLSDSASCSKNVAS